MPFDSTQFDSLLPSYLTKQQKDRLKDSLKQFKAKIDSVKTITKAEDSGVDFKSWDPKFYTDFYASKSSPYFMQGDLIREVRMPNWNSSTISYDKSYIDGIIITNTCDMDFSNEVNRSLSKKVLFAPMVPLGEYLQNLQQSGAPTSKITSIEENIKSQLLSNVFYLPGNYVNQLDYIVSFDQLSWLPSEEVAQYANDIEVNRIVSLGLFGYYLFVLKLSYHFCRLPEDSHRAEWE